MGETTQGRTGKWAKRPGGETIRGERESGRNDSGANGKVGETTRIRRNGKQEYIWHTTSKDDDKLLQAHPHPLGLGEIGRLPNVLCERAARRLGKRLIEPHHAKTCHRGFSTRQVSKQPAQLQKLARILKL